MTLGPTIHKNVDGGSTAKDASSRHHELPVSDSLFLLRFIKYRFLAFRLKISEEEHRVDYRGNLEIILPALDH